MENIFQFRGVLGLAAARVCLAGCLLTAANAPALAETSGPPGHSHTPRMVYLENEALRLGIDLNLGGAITCLAPATNHTLNVINSYDWGRQVQLSYYSGPNPFHPPGTTISTHWQFLGWNPIQSGDYYGFKSRVLEHTNLGRSLYVKCIPMQWPLKNVSGECECEVWLELDGPVVLARCRLTNHRSDIAQYDGRTQEMPAVYVNAPFHRLMTYRGARPFTGDALSRITMRLDKDGGWDSWIATENWAAQVNDAGWGLGVWSPETSQFSGGFFQEPGQGGPNDAPTGYIAPNRREILDHNIVHDYRYELILGTLDEIRAHALRRAREHPITHRFRFEKDRQGWVYADATDAGWPVQGELKVLTGSNDPQLISPVFFAATTNAARVVFEAAFENTGKSARIYWRGLGDKGFAEERAREFSVKLDGVFHRYEIALTDGASPLPPNVVQLRLDPEPVAGVHGGVRVRSVVLQP